jgi:tRNA pseudouridine38-40 synthase
MRYFIEVAYKGGAYSGFQIQENADTIQARVEKALHTVLRIKCFLTGSSRTDAGVHARQNFFHFDFLGEINDRLIYHLNAVLPADIVIKSIRKVDDNAHCRYDAKSRLYQYSVTIKRDPFVTDSAYYYPYTLDVEALQTMAQSIIGRHDFTSFCKKNTQVGNFFCDIHKADWSSEKDRLFFQVQGNRFLRGMVRGLVGTMLRLARKEADSNHFYHILLSKNSSKVDFSVPAHGLCLMKVLYQY